MINLIFCNLFYSGSSAIVPILEDFLRDSKIINVLNFGPEKTDQLFTQKLNEPFFHWTHHAPEIFNDAIMSGKFKFVYLHRDPRDVAISYVEDHIHRGLANRENVDLLYQHLPAQHNIQAAIRGACNWVKLSNQFPDRIMVTNFKDMKQDTPSLVIRILSFYGIDMNDANCNLVRTLYHDKYSFQAMTNRERGSDGETVRNRYMLRKGLSDQWKVLFDEKTQSLWIDNLGPEIQALGYGLK